MCQSVFESVSEDRLSLDIERREVAPLEFTPSEGNCSDPENTHPPPP
jgi:hypothetical protein